MRNGLLGQAKRQRTALRSDGEMDTAAHEARPGPAAARTTASIRRICLFVNLIQNKHEVINIHIQAGSRDGTRCIGLYIRMYRYVCTVYCVQWADYNNNNNNNKNIIIILIAMEISLQLVQDESSS